MNLGYSVISKRVYLFPSPYNMVPTQIAFSNSLCFPCFFPVQLQIFPVPIYIIYDYYIHKTDLPDLFPALEKKWKFSRQISQYPLPLESGNIELDQTKLTVFSLCFGKISKFPVFSRTGNIFGRFPCFPCAVGTLLQYVGSSCARSPSAYYDYSRRQNNVIVAKV